MMVVRRVALAAVSFITLAAAGCSSSAKAAAPDPLDFGAAKACQSVVDYLASKATDRPDALVRYSTSLSLETSSATASSLALPKYSTLGSAIGDLLSAAADGNASALANARDAITAQCATIPAAAQKAGGYTK